MYCKMLLLELIIRLVDCESKQRVQDPTQEECELRSHGLLANSDDHTSLRLTHSHPPTRAPHRDTVCDRWLYF